LLPKRGNAVLNFRNQGIVITGGSSGLGLELARRLAAEGARLTLIARDRDRLERAAQELRAQPGGATVRIESLDIRDEAAVRDAVRTLLAFNARESCGKCTPCREGTARLLAMLDGPVDSRQVAELSEVIQLASLCGLGQAAPLAVLSGLREFPAAFR